MRRLVFLLLLSTSTLARADEVRLKGGTKIDGIVLARDEKVLRILLPEGVEMELSTEDVEEVVADADAPKLGEGVRYVNREKEGEALQTAVITLVSPSGGPRVDLVGAVHIGEADYYHRVQALLEQAEVVLYEMVKPKGADPEALPEGPNPIRDFQVRFGRLMNLPFQLDEICYRRSHFVHADMEPEAVTNGKGLPPSLAIPLAIISVAMKVAEKSMESGTPEAMGRRRALKRLVARTLGQHGSNAGALLGRALDDVIIKQRNAIVVERLRELPPTTRNVAIFYGVGHFADLEKRIVEGLGYRRAGARWMDAWWIPPEDAGKTK